MTNSLTTLQDLQKSNPLMASGFKSIVLWSASGLLTDETLQVQIFLNQRLVN